MRPFRARRLLSQRKRAPLKSNNAPKAGEDSSGRPHDGFAQDQASSDALPLPTVLSPRHPHAFRFENAAFKYTTGVVAVPPSFQRSFNATEAAFKIYSQDGLTPSACSSVRNLIVAGDNLHTANSLSVVLKNLYHVNTKAYAIADSVLGVFFQVFRSRADLKSLRLPWTVIPATWRQWNLYCETYRSHPEGTMCVPQVQLALTGIYPRQPTAHSLWSNTDPKIELRVNANMKPSLLRATKSDEHTPTTATESPSMSHVQKIVDDIICAVVSAATQSTLIDPAAFVTKLSAAVTAYFSGSDLHSLLDFQSLEMVVTNHNRQRYVSSILLNRDGSERNWRTEKQIEHQPTVKVTGGDRVNSVVLSEATIEKLGVGTVNASANCAPGASDQSKFMRAAELIQEFDAVFRTLHETGFEGCLHAAHYLAQRYPETMATLNFPPLKLAGTDSVVLGLELNHDSGVANLSINIPNPTITVRVSGAEDIDMQIVNAALVYGLRERKSAGDQKEHSLRETAIAEVALIKESLQSICSNAAQKVQFSAPDEIPTKLAEIVLEVLNLPSLGIALEKVRLSARPVSDPQAYFRGEAPRETAPAQSDLSSRQQSVVEKTTFDSHVDLPSSSRSPGDSAHGQMYSKQRADKMSSISSHLPSTRNGLRESRGSKMVFDQPWLRSKTVQDYTGFEYFKIEITWERTNSPTSITSQRTADLVDDGVKTGFQTKSSSLFHTIMSNFFAVAPVPKLVNIQFSLDRRDPRLSQIPFTENGSKTPLLLQLIQSSHALKAGSDEGNEVMFIVCPPFPVPLELESEYDKENTCFELAFKLRGRFRPEMLYRGATMVEHTSTLFKAIYTASFELASKQTFPNLQEFANRLAGALFTGRDDLSEAIEIGGINLKAWLRGPGHNAVAKETASAMQDTGSAFQRRISSDGSYDVYASRPVWSAALKQHTGLENYSVDLARPKKEHHNLPNIKPLQLRDAFDHALEASSQIGLDILNSVVSELASLDPSAAYIQVFFGTPNFVTASSVPRTGIKTFFLLTCRKRLTKGGSSPESPANMNAELPVFLFPIQLGTHKWNSGRKVYFRVEVDFLLHHTDLSPSPRTVKELVALDETIYRTIEEGEEGLRERGFPSLQALTIGVLNLLFNKRHQLSSDFNIQRIELIAFLRSGTWNSPVVEKLVFERKLGEEAVEKLPYEAEDWDENLRQPETHTDAHKAKDSQINTFTTAATLSNPEPTKQFEDGNDETNASAELSTITSEPFGRNDQEEATSEQVKQQPQSTGTWRTAFIALGSNVGDRLRNIEDACRELDAEPDIRIVQTSTLYESDAMYYTDQDPFLNGACEVVTKLEPIDLLDRLQAIENRLGRIKTIDKGPRNIDLDIILYGEMSVNTERLTIPHSLMHEREFVLRPLVNMRRGDRQIPGRGISVRRALKNLPASANPLRPFVPLDSGSQHINTFDSNRATRIMSVLNVTPDSFSDGGDNQTTDLESLKETIRSQIKAGATIIDVGGQSSRPNAPDVTAEEEISRILPAIEAVRSLPEASDIIISVDTYRAAVAEAAIGAGAHIINDISAGQLDPDMLPTIARLGCTYIMMHMRGTPANMMSEENCSYPGGLIDEVGYELGRQVTKALKLGVRRWRIILDPGIGFSKTPEQNVQLLKELPQLRQWFKTSPWLIGTSRKSFIGKLTGVEDPKQRVWGTAATVTAAVMGGADVVRVHDVKEMADVVKMADAMYRV